MPLFRSQENVRNAKKTVLLPKHESKETKHNDNTFAEKEINATYFNKKSPFPISQFSSYLGVKFPSIIPKNS
jgi:hypothetical protein